MAGARRGRERKTEKRSDEKEVLRREENAAPRRGSLTNFFPCRHHHVVVTAGRKWCSVSLCKQRDSTSKSSPQRCLRPGNGRAIPTSASASASFSSSSGGSLRGMHLSRLSGCYECHMVADPISSILRDSALSCPDCGQVFMKSDSLELHQTARHAVSELGPEDSSRNIVEIIFHSSWAKKQALPCRIERILKIRSSSKTIARFEEYRNSIKSKASKLPKKNPRCIADGNELLRFYCASLSCSLGLNGSTNLCTEVPKCRICGIIRDGVKADSLGRIRTTGASGRAHDMAQISHESERRGMLVCRVIAGRVKRGQDASEDFDSVVGGAGMYSSMDEIFVFNPRAILPCFVVVYTAS